MISIAVLRTQTAPAMNGVMLQPPADPAQIEVMGYVSLPLVLEWTQIVAPRTQIVAKGFIASVELAQETLGKGAIQTQTAQEDSSVLEVFVEKPASQHLALQRRNILQT